MEEVVEIKLRNMMGRVSKEELEDVFVTFVTTPAVGRRATERFKELSRAGQALLLSAMLTMMITIEEGKGGDKRESGG